MSDSITFYKNVDDFYRFFFKKLCSFLFPFNSQIFASNQNVRVSNENDRRQKKMRIVTAYSFSPAKTSGANKVAKFSH